MTCPATIDVDGVIRACIDPAGHRSLRHHAWLFNGGKLLAWTDEDGIVPLRAAGRSTTKRQQREAGLVRLDVWLPPDAARALERLCAREAEATGRPATQLRTAVVIRALREAGRERR